ncbi:UxaA family hydrolase [Bacillus taeanensis]|uniref:Altronate dehydratase n=1 Tax=Bacillus taeanensis TaxID=273032 RepID=A0A366XTN4_9BACI|nr:altronate dehydratase family protein [Bacillus taeanensis]RBW69730.1 altronate dehydratase [Bacillus taeanensis]
MTQDYIVVHQDDNVFVALKPYKKGERITVNDKEIELTEDIPFGHKAALKTIPENEDVIKYGFPIGKASKKIDEGNHVHTHNVVTKLEGTLDYSYEPTNHKVTKDESLNERTFKGYVRSNGEVGIRNEIWIINTVGCINKVAEHLAKLANQTFKNDNIDGVYHYPHPFGCSQLGDDLTNTQKILRNLVNHPNAAGVLVLGLGCENNNIAEFKKVLGEYDESRVKFLGTQGVDDELEAGLEKIQELVLYAKSFQREDVPVSKLRVGLKCGGSDGLSGITANPLVGAFSDKLIRRGGTTVLTEVPEMFGAETILMERAQNEEVFSKTVNLINDFKTYFIKHDQVVYENPSPGNKDGGITTLEEKSLGCVQKGGFAEIVDVHSYGGYVTKPGLNLLQGPGNDLVSVTSLAASGAHIVLFTTGRGTPFGGPVPTVKISTNSALYNKKKNWIDFNAGQLIEDKTMDELSNELFDYIIKLASGEMEAKNEQFGFKEIAIFKDGVIL